ncbi:unnamed protein product, partial [Rotaria sp. Silwood2]
MNFFLQDPRVSLLMNKNTIPDVRADVKTILNKLVQKNNSYKHLDEDHAIYAKLPFDVHRHCLLVTYPVITIDSRVHTGLQVLVKEYQCKQSNMISITSFSTPDEIKHICELYP